MINVEGWDRERGCGRGGPYIARAVHSPGRLREVLVSVGCRLAAREIIAEPSGESRTLRGRVAHDRIAFSTDSLSERASGTTADAIAEFLLRCADLGQITDMLRPPP